MDSIAVFVLTQRGLGLGKDLSSMLGADLYHPAGLGRDGTPFEDIREAVGEAFQRYRGLIFIMAAGIVVRLISPLLKGKDVDPAVVVMDEGGRYAISLLSGHLGGANRLAERIGRLTGAQPVVTTATDVHGLPSIEAIASSIECRIEGVERIKSVNSAILRGERILCAGDDEARLERLGKILGEMGVVVPLGRAPQRGVSVVVTERVCPDLPKDCLLLRPMSVVVGVGCERGVGLEEIERAYQRVLRRWGISPLSVVRVATIDVKRDEEGLLAFSRRHGLGVEFFSREELSDLPLPSGTSHAVLKAIGIGGVCEPAAMRSAGVREVLFRKEKVGRVTFAAARIPFRGRG